MLLDKNIMNNERTDTLDEIKMGSENSETSSLDFSEFWGNTSVNREVLWGARLREEKPNCSRESDQFTPIDIHINGVVKKKRKHRRGKRKIKVINQKCTEKYRCPMRIAELAVPNKRQCLDTWRNRGNILPNFMVDRLRQHVMDQKAVVHIDDAIHCFKAYKAKRSRQRKVNRRKTDHKNYKAKLFCGYFGHRIVLKLLSPAQIPVPSSLKNLMEIVNNDIEELFQGGKYIKINKLIQNDISKKVTVWIANVVEESDIKLMMDDFKDLEETEGHIWDIIDDVIGIVTERCKSDSITNIKEEYASANSSFLSIKSSTSNLSLNTEDDKSINESIHIETETTELKLQMIDVLLSHILDNICGYENQTKTTTFVESLLENTISEVLAIGKKETNTEIVKMPIVEIELPEIRDVGEVNAMDELVWTMPHGKNESIAFDGIDMENKDNVNIYLEEPYQNVALKDSSKSTDNVFINGTNNSESKVDNNIEKIQSLERAVHTAQTENTHELSDALNQLTLSPAVPSIENGLDANVSAGNLQIQINDFEEWPDDSLKKVKFSHTNIGNEQRSIDEAKNEDESILHKKILSNSSINLKHINFAPPNKTLLYKVDETWPEDFLPLTSKLSATISKSVISLGFINEGDEPSISSYPDTRKEREQNIKEQCITELSNLSEEINEENNYLQKITLRDINNTNRAIELKDESYRTSQGHGSACLHIKRSHEMGDNRDTNVIVRKDVGRLQKNRKLAMHVQPCINIDSEVTTALTKEKQIQTEVKRIKMKPKHKLKRQDEVRIWCKGLYNVANNMEKWFNWLNSVTNIVTLQLRKNDKHCIKTQKDKIDFLKEWLQLKENIYTDAKLWHHLYKRLIIGINSFKDDNNIKTKVVKPKSCICQGF